LKAAADLIWEKVRNWYLLFFLEFLSFQVWFDSQCFGSKNLR
jgi:hypothetical protein